MLSQVFKHLALMCLPWLITTLDPPLQIMISQVIRIGFFQPFDMILKFGDEDQKRGKNQKKSNFRTPNRLQLPDVVFCFSGVTPNSRFIGNLESEDSPKFQEISIIFLGFSGTKLSYKTGFSYGLHSPMTYIRMSPALHLQFGWWYGSFYTKM